MPRAKLYTKEELLERRRQHYRENKARIIADNSQRNKAVVARRRELLSQFDCRSCGCCDPSVIQWHHVDPDQKEFELFRTAWPEEKFWDEVLKCIPLCANCHVKIHQNLLCLINPIGFKHQQAIANISAAESTCRP